MLRLTSGLWEWVHTGANAWRGVLGRGLGPMLQVLLHGCRAAHGSLCCEQLLAQLLQGVCLSRQCSLHLGLLLC